MPNNLDKLLHLIGVLGADAAWLLRGAEGVGIDYTFGEADDDDHPDGVLSPIDGFGPVLFVARFPDDGSEEVGIAEMRLPPGAADREIQAAALLNAALDNLTRIGPNTTARVLRWLFERYGIEPPRFGGDWTVRDRRPRSSRPEPAPPPPEPTPGPPDIRAALGASLREQRQTLDISQHLLAQQAGLTQVQISAMERGVGATDDAAWDRVRAALDQIRKEKAT